nr:putative reverse transcriptase domain-containing protein [Tanacetum cinerariifolium]
MDSLARLYLNEIITRLGMPISIISDHDSRFTSRKPLEFSVGDHVLLKVSPWKGVVRFGKKGKLAPSYDENRRKPLEFSVGDHVLLKVSPWKGVVRFGKKGKLAPRFVGPFEITERISPVAYRLRLPQELNGVHDTFHMSNLKKCLVDPTLHVPLEEIQVNAKLNFVEDPVEILKREFKKLKWSRIDIVKARWNSKQEPEFT